MQIDYKKRGETNVKRGVASTSAGEGESEEVGPITLPNGSIYTGQRMNNKKHGRG